MGFFIFIRGDKIHVYMSKCIFLFNKYDVIASKIYIFLFITKNDYAKHIQYVYIVKLNIIVTI